MIQAFQVNSVSKNNFISLMTSYEKNYKDFSKLVDLSIITESNISKKFESSTGHVDKKLSLSVELVTNHTAQVRFAYNFFSNNTYINYVDLKIYFDSRQAEIINTNDSKSMHTATDINKYHNMRLSKWYKNYFLSIWLKNCIKNGYSFEAQSEV